MKQRIKSICNRVYNWIKSHKAITWTVSIVLSTIIGWLFSLVLPTKPVVASNIPQKELTCTFNYSLKLITKRTADKRLQVLYDGKPVDDPWVTNITILNSGDLAVENADFKDQFVISFKDSEMILNANISKFSNTSLLEEVLSNSSTKGENLVITDFFLNPGESFSISIITNQKPSKISYHSRISGISELTLKNAKEERKSTFSWIVWIVSILVCITVIAVVIMLVVERRRTKQMDKMIATLRLKTKDDDTTDDP